jgi:hypothetical protein
MNHPKTGVNSAAEKERSAPHTAAATNRQGAAGGRSLGATIRSIEITGRRFELQDDTSPKGGPGWNPR